MTGENQINQNIKKIEELRKAFHKTPLLKIIINYKGKIRKVYAKSEISSFSGSVKDRMVSHIIKKSYLNGSLKINDTIIEVSSGCTGIAISTLGGLLGHKVEIVIPDWFSKTRYKMLKILGAEIQKISREEGGFIKCLNIASEKLKQGGYFYVSQFDNALNVDAHFCNTAPDLFKGFDVGNEKFILSLGVGSGGTIIGIHKYCLKNNIDCLCFPMEPASSPLFSSAGKTIGNHRIEGIADDFIPENSKMAPDLFQSVISIDDGDAILMAQKLNKHGFAVGISSGGNFLATLKIAERYNFTRTPLTIFPDGSIKYTSTDLFKTEPAHDNYLSKDIDILEVKVHSWKSHHFASNQDYRL